MHRPVDVAKLARVALCFAGIAIILSGMQNGLTMLEERAIPPGHITTGENARHVVGMLIFCPLIFAKVGIGIFCIRRNEAVIRFAEKFSRKKSRRGRKQWKAAEKHAFLAVGFGLILFYCGVVDILNTTAFLVQQYCAYHAFFGGMSAREMGLGLLMGLGMILLLLIPPLLLVLFARQWTGWISRAFLLR